MRIIVCLKRVPDTGTLIEIDSTGLDIKRDVPWVCNPFDEIALEQALRLKERYNGELTVICASAEDCEDVLRKALALGADNAVCVKDPCLANIEPISVARVISAVIRALSFDLIICGRMSTDTGAGIVGPAIAAQLGLPCVCSIKQLEVDAFAGAAIAITEAAGVTLTLACRLPALFTVDRGLCVPRYPSLSGIMKAKKAPIRYVALSEIGLDAAALTRSTIKRTRLSYPARTRKGVILDGNVAKQVKEAMGFLKAEAKVI